MKYLDEAALPADLQCPRPLWRMQKAGLLVWLDPGLLPPVQIPEGWLAPDHAMALAAESTGTRQALKRHATPETLDRFVAAFCRIVPDDSVTHHYFGTIAAELGGSETIQLMLAAMIRSSRTPNSRRVHGAAKCLAELGDLTCLPAMVLALSRVDPKKERMQHWWLSNQLAALCKRLQVSSSDWEDWSVPDAAESHEIDPFSQEQAQRLKHAMLTERRWTVDRFHQRIVHQAILSPLAAWLVWGYYSSSGKLLQPFLIAADLRYPEPPPAAVVGIVHPAHLPADQVVFWRDRTRHLPAPFDQWAPPVNALSAGELEQNSITRLPAIKLPAATLLCRLEELGWLRTRNDGTLRFHIRRFPEMGIHAVIGYSGIPLTYGGEWTDQAIESCIFVADKKQLQLSKVSPIAISAVLSDLEALGAKPQTKKK